MNVVPNSALERQDREQLLLTARQLLAEAQALSSRIAAVNEIATAINRSLKLDEILRVVGKQAKWLLDFQHLSVYICSNGSCSLITLFGAVIELGAGAIAPESPILRAIKTKQPQLIRDFRNPNPNGDSPNPVGLDTYASQLIVPLECDRLVMGTINFATKLPGAYNQEDLRIGYLLALQLSSAIRNAESYKELQQLYAQIEIEKQKSDQLLLNILPLAIAEELKQTGKVKPVHYESASVLFTDFKNFTKSAETLSPQDLVDELDYCFSCFDQFIEAQNLEKLKTIGDSYMCVGGIPTSNYTHAIDAILAALNLRTFMEWRKIEKMKTNQSYWEIRIGIHSGALLAGAIGNKKFAYDVWGDTVNIAARMESSGIPGTVNVSQSTFELTQDFFEFEHRGKIKAKNKGKIDMYIVKGIKKNLSLDPLGLLPNQEFNQLYWSRSLRSPS
jgi:class 3 adenylate cyclase